MSGDGVEEGSGKHQVPMAASIKGRAEIRSLLPVPALTFANKTGGLHAWLSFARTDHLPRFLRLNASLIQHLTIINSKVVVTMAATKWVPLEANPELFTSWCSSMGMDTSKFAFHDIYGTDPDLLAMVPQPVAAVLLLFPVTESVEKLRSAEAASATYAPSSSDTLWFKQTIGNACGTIGLLHSLANSSASSAIQPDSPLDTLFKKARATDDADERAKILVNSKELQSVHAATASQGQSQAPEDLDNVLCHFIAFVRSEQGDLLELDGAYGRKGPLIRGKKVDKQEDLLPVAVEFVKEHYVSISQHSETICVHGVYNLD